MQRDRFIAVERSSNIRRRSLPHIPMKVVIDLNVRRKLSVSKPGVEHSGRKNVCANVRHHFHE